LDICEAVALVLAAPQDAVHTQVFNVGSDDQNYRVREIAELVGRVFPDCTVTLGPSGGDHRSYRVSFQKIGRHLPEFRCHHDAVAGARQLRRVFEAIQMSDEVFESRPYTRLKQLEYLIATGRLDAELFWIGQGASGEERDVASGRHA
jgi:nucleoside-diphosphate-sugar epimerase